MRDNQEAKQRPKPQFSHAIEFSQQFTVRFYFIRSLIDFDGEVVRVRLGIMWSETRAYLSGTFALNTIIILAQRAMWPKAEEVAKAEIWVRTLRRLMSGSPSGCLFVRCSKRIRRVEPGFSRVFGKIWCQN